MAQSKRDSIPATLRQQLLRDGTVKATSVSAYRSHDPEASRANAIAARKAELHKVPALFRKPVH